MFVRISSDRLYGPGTIVIDPKIEKELEAITRVLRQFPNHLVSIEGHTDDQPVIKRPFADNLMLSAHRAAVVSSFLKEEGELPHKNFRAVGYGDLKPIADNKSQDGRKKNRRVEIVLGPQPQHD